MTQFDSKEKLVRLASSGHIIGHRSLNSNNIYSVSAITLSDTEVTTYPKKDFENALKESPKFCFEFMMFLADELLNSEKHMKAISSMPVKCRIAKAILINALSFGWDENDSGKLNLTLPRKDIANYALTTYETVIRKLKELSDEKVIELDNKSILISDIDALKKQAMEIN